MIRVALLLFLALPATATAQDAGTEATATAEAAPASDGDALPRLERATAPEWAPAIERECERRRGMRYESCDGPRRVVLADEEARARAERLGLGTHAAADTLWTGAPPAEWVAEAGTRHAGLLWPAATGLFSRGFGAARVHDHVSGSHVGLDVVAEEGAHLRAVDDALVAYADNGIRGLGNVLFLVLADGSVAIYAHCESLLVAAGSVVRRGALVATLGSTGLTVRAHLHFEWRIDGTPRDPMPEMVERPSFRRRDEEDGVVTWRPAPPNRAESEAASEAPTPPADDRAPHVEYGPVDAAVSEREDETKIVVPPTPPDVILALGASGGEEATSPR